MSQISELPTLYGITNCSTVRSARAWLEARNIAYTFHDYKKAGIQADKLERWCDDAGWEAVINRSGTTFRKLPDSGKVGLDIGKAITLMREQPSMIRRPILEHAGNLLIGFDELRWSEFLRPRP